MPHAEIKLALLIVLLYGSTCVAWLYANEGVIEQGFDGLRLRLGSGFLRLGGRSPLLLNPLLPVFPAYRGLWGAVGTPAAEPGMPAAVCEHLRACRRLAPFVVPVFMLVVLALPISLLAGRLAWAVLALALGYAAAATLLLRLWWLRTHFGLDARRFAKLAFENLVCLPFAAGLPRQLGAMQAIDVDLADACRDWPAAARTRAMRDLLQRSDEQLAMYPDEAPERTALAAYRDRLAAAGNEPVASHGASHQTARIEDTEA